MRHVAVLGATSRIASDLVLGWAADQTIRATLFARSPETVRQWIAGHALGPCFTAAHYDDFPAGSYDAIINFVGVGDPARMVRMGATILDITQEYDQLALRYLRERSECRYLFLSSGAAYGSSFLEPAGPDTKATLPINDIKGGDYYSLAKIYAEYRHRAEPELSIIDIRVFNYFSRNQDLNARFFITDIIRAIRDRQTLQTTDQPMVRDFIHPSDFKALVQCLLDAPPHVNTAVDCYSLAPVDKITLLTAMRDEFGLDYVITGQSVAVDRTGSKPNYYSTYRRAEEFGYVPHFAASEAVQLEVSAFFAG